MYAPAPVKACAKTMFVLVFVAGMGLASAAFAETDAVQQPHSPVYSGIANMFSGTASEKATDAEGEQTTKRPTTREEYRAAREARKAAEEENNMPLPEDMVFNKTTGQWQRVVRYKSGGKYMVSTTCYEISHESKNSRVFRPVGCITQLKTDDK